MGFSHKIGENKLTLKPGAYKVGRYLSPSLFIPYSQLFFLPGKTTNSLKNLDILNKCHFSFRWHDVNDRTDHYPPSKTETIIIIDIYYYFIFFSLQF